MGKTVKEVIYSKMNEYQNLKKDFMYDYAEKLLKTEDCYDKLYAPDNKKSEEYPSWEVVNGVTKYFKKIPINLTEDQYDDLIIAEENIRKLENSSRSKFLIFFLYLIGIAFFLVSFYFLILSGTLQDFIIFFTVSLALAGFGAFSFALAKILRRP